MRQICLPCWVNVSHASWSNKIACHGVSGGQMESSEEEISALLSQGGIRRRLEGRQNITSTQEEQVPLTFLVSNGESGFLPSPI